MAYSQFKVHIGQDTNELDYENMKNLISNNILTVLSRDVIDKLNHDKNIKYVNCIDTDTLSSIARWPDLNQQDNQNLSASEIFLLLRKISDKKRNELLKTEVGIFPVLRELETKGFFFSMIKWKEIVQDKLSAIESERKLIASDLHLNDINLDNPIPIIESLRTMGISIDMLTTKSLEKMADNYTQIRRILEYRKHDVTWKFYSDGIMRFFDGCCFKATWNSIQSASLRMGAKKPPLQSFPAVSRGCFRTSSSDNVLISSDFSQIELRILAEKSKDQNLVRMFNNGIDVHRYMASVIFHEPLEQVTDEQRKIAKIFNFAILYGCSAEGLYKIFTKKGVNVCINEATLYRSRFFDSFPDIRRYQQRLLQASYIDLQDGFRMDASGLTPQQRLNMPMQFSASNGFKNAVRILAETKPVDTVARMLLHDEIVVEVPKVHAEERRIWLENCMKNGMSFVLKNVPVEVESIIDNYWKK